MSDAATQDAPNRGILTLCVIALLCLGVVMVQSASMRVTGDVRWQWTAAGMQHIKFSIFALINPLTGLRVDTLYEKCVGPGVHTITSFTFAGHAWAEKFGHAKFVIGSDVEEFF